MNFNIEPHHFEELIKNQYSLDYVYLLKLIDEGFNIREMCESSERIKALHTSLIRRGLIYDEETTPKLTIQGKHLLSFISVEGEIKIKKEKVDSDLFDRWWDTFPKRDEFEYKGVYFAGERGFRVKKDECRVKFNKILIEGEYSIDQLIRALQKEVIQKKEASVRHRENRLKYLHNTLTYLNQRDFNNFIEDSSSPQEEEESSYNGGAVDI